MEKPIPSLRRLLPWLPAAVWYAVICFFSAQTGPESTAVSDTVLTDFLLLDLSSTSPDLLLSLSFLVRKGAHMFVFFLLTALLLLPLKERIQKPGMQYAAALALCAVLAALDELHQLFVPGRSGRLSDVLIDAAGGACFLILFGLIQSRQKRKEGTA